MDGFNRDAHRIRYLPTALLFPEPGKDFHFLIVRQSVVLRIPVLFGFSQAMPGTIESCLSPVYPLTSRNESPLADWTFVFKARNV